jgi:hypothetical protein
MNESFGPFNTYWGGVGPSPLLLVLVEDLGEVLPALVVVDIEILLIHSVIREL